MAWPLGHAHTNGASRHVGHNNGGELMRYGWLLMFMVVIGCGSNSGSASDPSDTCSTIGYVYCTRVHFDETPQRANFQLLDPRGDTTTFACPGPYPPSCMPYPSDANAMTCDRVVLSLPALVGAFSLLVEPEGGTAVQVPLTTTAGPRCVPLGDYPRDLNVSLRR